MKTETWGDTIRYFRGQFPQLVALLDDAELFLVIKNMFDEVSRNKDIVSQTTQKELLKRFLRLSDTFINVIYEDEIYNKDIPKRMKVDKFFNTVVPKRREACRQKIQSGEKISLAQIERAFEIIIERDGFFAAMVFVLEHLDLIDARYKPNITEFEKELISYVGTLLAQNTGTSEAESEGQVRRLLA